MDLNATIFALKDFYYSYKLLSWALAAGIIILLLAKPKAAGKTLGGLALFILLIYGFAILGKTSSSGLKNKNRMINQTLDRDR